MPLGMHRIVLQPQASEEEFETFVTEELFPAAKTLIDIRIGPVEIRHLLARAGGGGDDGAWREYLWLVEVQQEAIDAFPVDLGADLKARLDAFGARLYRSYGIVGRAEERTTTPNLIHFADAPPDERGWVGK